MKALRAFLIAVLFAGSLRAAAFEDWTVYHPEEPTQGVWVDGDGSTLTGTQVAGPEAGQTALRIDANLVQWGGLWMGMDSSVPASGGLRFEAQSGVGTEISVMLTDDQKVQVEHVVRLTGGGWETFALPVSAFNRTEYQDPGAPAKAAFDFGKITALSLSPHAVGESSVTVGPIEAVADKVQLKDGEPAADVVQDFVTLQPEAYGPFADDQGSLITLEVKKGAPQTDGVAAFVDYSEIPKGWCGEWIRAGQDWKGQDWRGAKNLVVEIYSEDALSVLFAFNDANHNAYQSTPFAVAAGAWQKVTVPITAFVLDSHYQPANAKLGAAEDLSVIEAFNISPLTEGKHSFWIRGAVLER